MKYILSTLNPVTVAIYSSCQSSATSCSHIAVPTLLSAHCCSHLSSNKIRDKKVHHMLIQFDFVLRKKNYGILSLLYLYIITINSIKHYNGPIKIIIKIIWMVWCKTSLPTRLFNNRQLTVVSCDLSHQLAVYDNSMTVTYKNAVKCSRLIHILFK